MNLFFRLVFMVIRALFSRKTAPFYGPTRLKFRVWLTDQDMFAHMTNSRYSSFSDLGTINYLIRAGFGKVLRKRGWAPVVCAQSMVVSRMLKTPQSFDIETHLVAWNETYIGLQHTFIRNDRPTAHVYVLGRLTAQDRSKPTPHDLALAMGVTEKSPEFTQPFLKLIEVADGVRRPNKIKRQIKEIA